LATFNVTAGDGDQYDDLSDLSTMEMESVKEWETQFKGKFSSICYSLGFIRPKVRLQCITIKLSFIVDYTKKLCYVDCNLIFLCDHKM